MRVLSVIHQADAGSGVFADAVAERGGELTEWNVAERATPPAEPESYDAVLVFGGAMHVDQEERHPWLREEEALLRRLLRAEIPLLGVCLGAQLIAKALGAPVGRLPQPEIGWYEVELTPEARSDPIFAGLPGRFASFQWHSYAFELPAGAAPLARTPVGLQAYRSGKSAWGIQFHAEVTRENVVDWLESSRPADGRIDAERLLGETEERIAGWNELGRRLCARFLEAASSIR